MKLGPFIILTRSRLRKDVEEFGGYALRITENPEQVDKRIIPLIVLFVRKYILLEDEE